MFRQPVINTTTPRQPSDWRCQKLTYTGAHPAGGKKTKSTDNRLGDKIPIASAIWEPAQTVTLSGFYSWTDARIGRKHNGMELLSSLLFTQRKDLAYKIGNDVLK